MGRTVITMYLILKRFFNTAFWIALPISAFVSLMAGAALYATNSRHPGFASAIIATIVIGYGLGILFLALKKRGIATIFFALAAGLLMFLGYALTQKPDLIDSPYGYQPGLYWRNFGQALVIPALCGLTLLFQVLDNHRWDK